MQCQHWELGRVAEAAASADDEQWVGQCEEGSACGSRPDWGEGGVSAGSADG